MLATSESGWVVTAPQPLRCHPRSSSICISIHKHKNIPTCSISNQTQRNTQDSTPIAHKPTSPTKPQKPKKANSYKKNNNNATPTRPPNPIFKPTLRSSLERSHDHKNTKKRCFKTGSSGCRNSENQRIAEAETGGNCGEGSARGCGQACCIWGGRVEWRGE